MSTAMALEDLALGEVTLEQGAETVNAALSKLDEDMVHELYEALRSWVWKSLEARRRDDELPGWMDVLSRASAGIEDRCGNLAIKLEGFMELLHASIMTAGAAERRDPLQRKHVRAALGTIYQSGGRIRRGQLMHLLGLRAANLSRVMTSLQDDGLVVREVEGREAFYRLTIKGIEQIKPLVAHEGTALRTIAISTLKRAPVHGFDRLVFKDWKKANDPQLLYYFIPSASAIPRPANEPIAFEEFNQFDSAPLIALESVIPSEYLLAGAGR